MNKHKKLINSEILYSVLEHIISVYLNQNKVQAKSEAN